MAMAPPIFRTSIPTMIPSRTLSGAMAVANRSIPMMMVSSTTSTMTQTPTAYPIPSRALETRIAMDSSTSGLWTAMVTAFQTLWRRVVTLRHRKTRTTMVALTTVTSIATTTAFPMQRKT